jgi:hypothetical protein
MSCSTDSRQPPASRSNRPYLGVAMRSNFIATILIWSASIGSINGSKVDLLSLGSANFPIAPGSSIFPPQTATSLEMSGSIGIGDTFYNGTPFSPVSSYDWSGYFNYGLTMTLLGGEPISLSFNVTFFDDNFVLIDTYEGNTAELTLLGTPVDVDFAGISAPGSGDYSNVQYMQFTWSDAGTVDVGVQTVYGRAGGTFTVRAPGGARFLTSTNNTAGVVLNPNAGSWAALSDANTKTQVTAIDHRKNLRTISALPVTAWQYKHDPTHRYVGPMAQDFHQAFGLGSDERYISTLDADGVALSAVKGLIEELLEGRERSAIQARRLAELEAEIQMLQEQIQKTTVPAW